MATAGAARAPASTRGPGRGLGAPRRRARAGEHEAGRRVGAGRRRRAPGGDPSRQGRGATAMRSGRRQRARAAWRRRGQLARYVENFLSVDLYSKAFSPGSWHQPGLKVGISPGWCHQPGPKASFQQPKGRETGTKEVPVGGTNRD